MSKVTTLQIGGEAKNFRVVKTEAELIKTIKEAKSKNQEFMIIGGGSNLLVSDEGIDKLVIKNELSGVRVPEEIGPLFLKVASGVVLQDLVDYTISHGLSGLHHMTGIPGTVGGAIYGNAGAYGQTISDHITEVRAIDPSVTPARRFEEASTLGVRRFEEASTLGVKAEGIIHGIGIYSKEQCEFNYRDSGFKKNGLIILETTFKLESANPTTLKKEADEILQQRLVKYPQGIKCPGSFFKNILAKTLPSEILAKIPEDKIPFGKVNSGFLLESVGAKGQREGDIEVAEVHANLLINRGNGTAKDFYKLAKRLAAAVKVKYGITLESEVQLINLPPLIS